MPRRYYSRNRAKLASNPPFMRQLSKRTQYSLRALYALTRKYGAGPVLITNLAQDESIPKKFLEQILLSLKSVGFVASKKGKGGGYVLAQAPERITIGAVIRAIEGPLAPLPCASETPFRKCDECADYPNLRYPDRDAPSAGSDGCYPRPNEPNDGLRTGGPCQNQTKHSGGESRQYRG